MGLFAVELRSIIDVDPFFRDVHVEAGFDDFAAGELNAAVLEFAEVFAAEPLFAAEDALAGEVFLGDARAVVGCGGDDVPVGRLVGVDPVEEAALVAGGAEDPEITVGGGEDGRER